MQGQIAVTDQVTLSLESGWVQFPPNVTMHEIAGGGRGESSARAFCFPSQTLLPKALERRGQDVGQDSRSRTCLQDRVAGESL